MEQKILYSLTGGNPPPTPFSPVKGDRVFLRGDLGAGKTTFSRHLIEGLLESDTPVKSPTYVYYNKYGRNIYHFDLYRLSSYEDFVNIGGEEILDNPDNICIIEWPELLLAYYQPTIDVEIRKTDDELVREMRINRINN